MNQSVWILTPLGWDESPKQIPVLIAAYREDIKTPHHRRALRHLAVPNQEMIYKAHIIFGIEEVGFRLLKHRDLITPTVVLDLFAFLQREHSLRPSSPEKAFDVVPEIKKAAREKVNILSPVDMGELQAGVDGVDVRINPYYSGRGMYGEVCFSLVVQSGANFGALLSAALGRERAEEMGFNFRTDSLGKATVHYAPNWKVHEGYKDPDLEEADSVH